MKCKVSVLDGEAEALPVLAAFPSGPPSELVHGNPEALQVYHFIGKKPTGGVKRQITLRGERMDYVGKVNGDAQMGAKFLVGLRNKTSGKMKIVAAGPVVPLVQEFRGQSAREEDEHEKQRLERADMAPMTAKERFEAKQLLIEKFGSKAKQQELRTKRSNIVSEANVNSHAAVMLSLAATAKKTKQHEISKTMQGIPVYNADATEEHKAYPVYDCIPKSELRELKTDAKPFIDSKSDLALLGYSPFIVSLARRSNTHPDLTDELRAQCLVHLAYCIQLKSCPRSFSNKKASVLLDPCPESTLTGLLNRFTEQTVDEKNYPVNSRPPKMGDKLLFHICCASLLLGGFEVDVSMLLPDLKMSEKEIEPYFFALGCKMRKRKVGESSEVKKVAVLTVPLTFPKPSKKLKR